MKPNPREHKVKLDNEISRWCVRECVHAHVCMYVCVWAHESLSSMSVLVCINMCMACGISVV